MDPNGQSELNSGRDGPARYDSYAALRIREFRLILLSKFLSTLGGQMVAVAIGWQLYERTRSPLALGLVGLVEIIPVVALTLPAGHLADTYSRRTIVIAGQASMAVATVGLALLSYADGPVWAMYGCLFGLATAGAFHGPASTAFVAQTVPTGLYANAVTWSSNAWQLAGAIGPALGGFVIALAGSATPVYAAYVVIALACAVLTSRIQGRPVERSNQIDSSQSLLAGIRFLRTSRLLLAAITLDLFAVLLGGATALLPAFAKDVLDVGPTGLGWLRAGPSIGASVMALLLAHRPLRKAGPALLWAVGGFGAATIVFGLSRSFALSLAMLILLGALDNISVVIRSALLLLQTPDHMRGRVSAVNNLFVGASNELGAFESGMLAALIGPIAAVVAGGVGTIVVVLAVAAIWPEVAAFGALHDQTPAPPG